MDTRPGLGGNPAGMWMVLALVLGTAGSVTLWHEMHERRPAQDFTLTSTGYENGTLAEPVTFSLSDYRGKTVVLDFMAVACTTCRIVAEDVLKPLHDRHGDGIAILSIDTWADPGSGNLFGGETDEALIELQQEENLHWRHALDTDGVYLKYSAIGLPKLVVVDPEGRIAYSETGSQDLSDVEAAVQASIAGEATPVAVLSVGLSGLAFAAGVASILTPCSVGLLPAYLGLLLQDASQAPAARRSHRVLWGGLATALGVVAVYAALAVVFWLAGDAIAPALPFLGVAVGLAMAAFGALALAGAWPRIAARLRVSQGVDARRGFFAFGLSYGLAGFACTGPLFLPILVAGFSLGPSWGARTFGLYALAVAISVLGAAGLVAFGEQTRLRRLLDRTRPVQTVVSVLLIGAGLYLTWYGAKANGWL